MPKDSPTSLSSAEAAELLAMAKELLKRSASLGVTEALDLDLDALYGGRLPGQKAGPDDDLGEPMVTEENPRDPDTIVPALDNPGPPPRRAARVTPDKSLDELLEEAIDDEDSLEGAIAAGLNASIDEVLDEEVLDDVSQVVPPSAPLRDEAPLSEEEIGELPTAVDGETSNEFGRYRHISLIGVGSMGEVHRVQDLVLGRNIAMKIVKKGLEQDTSTISRFVAEARAVARLDHPGILPVYELGHLPDGRFYFTMQEVRGRTLADVLRDVYAEPVETRWQNPDWPFRGLIRLFSKCCEALAYAHSKGVIHRDLKPENVIVGRYGSVLLLDWGLAKEWSTAPSTASMSIDVPALQQDTLTTIAGSILGTPAYMSPEQANGRSELHSPRSDVYSLGAMLYEILSGRPPYVGDYAIEVICMVQDGPPEPLAPEDPMIPQMLIDVCNKAMSREPQGRYANAGELVEALGLWLERARARERASAILAKAKRKATAIDRLLQRAEALRAEARIMRRALGPDAPLEAKRPLWQLEDEAGNLDQGSRVLETTVVQLARSALQIVPDLPEAHSYLADYYKSRHERAEAHKDLPAAAQFAMLLKSHARPRHRRYLEGLGAFTLFTDPRDSKVDIYRYVEKDRRLEPERFGRTQRTPIRSMELPIGSYLLKIRAKNHLNVMYPIHITRDHEWTGIAPGESSPRPILLPKTNAIGPDEVYIPAGYYQSGGDPLAYGGLPRSLTWVEGYVMMQDPVTHRLYLDFLHSLMDQGRQNEVLRYLPRGRTHAGPFARPLYARQQDGLFTIRAKKPDAFLDAPVVFVNALCGVMFGYWYSVRTGHRWHLPNESQWEKAARGVDGRFFPWGNQFDTGLCASGQLGEFPGPISAHHFDISPYGVRGLGGNVREWCEPHPMLAADSSVTEQQVIRYAARGGCIQDVDCRSASRRPLDPQSRTPFVGFRLVRPLTESAD